MHLCGASEDPRKFYFEQDQLIVVKKCKEFEVDVYERIFNPARLPEGEVDHSWKIFYSGLKKFVPEYYGANLYDIERARFNVKLQNLLNIHKIYKHGKVYSD